MPDHSLEKSIPPFGKEIFSLIGQEQPSAFSKRHWTGRIMEWAMTKPEMKANMFRLVDVLPALPSSRAIAKHVNEYLGEVGADIHGLLDWGLNVPPSSMRAKLTAIAVRKSVQQMAGQFIAGENPRKALSPLTKIRQDGMSFTVDLLGEYSVSEDEAQNYLERYLEALDILGEKKEAWSKLGPSISDHPAETTPICVSVKLSALYSQFSLTNFDQSVKVLSERLREIASRAKEVGATIYVDAEDTGRNPVVYRVFQNVFGEKEFRDMPFPGAVVQAYTKDSEAIVDELLAFSQQRENPIAIRLVKGAYWDSETILAEQHGWPSPVFSRKVSSDAQFELLSKKLLDNHALCLPAFGSHNIRSLSHACCYAETLGLEKKDFEIQVLFGMAEPIARAFTKKGFLVRLYVPLGEMIPGMGYLVRRLLENTSNESFLRHTFHDESDELKLLAPPTFAG